MVAYFCFKHRNAVSLVSTALLVLLVLIAYENQPAVARVAKKDVVIKLSVVAPPPKPVPPKPAPPKPVPPKPVPPKPVPPKQLIQSTGNKMLDRSALKAVRTAHFNPWPAKLWPSQISKNFSVKIEYNIEQ